MTNRIQLLLMLVLGYKTAFSQTPQQFSYQAVVRDNNNQLVANRTVGIRISILKDSVNGQASYTETHMPKTNTQGIVQLNIGGGTVVLGTFASVPWSSGKLYVKTEMDLQGGTNYSFSGTTQLLSVPYALYTSDVPVSKSGDTVTIGKSKLIIPGSQFIPGSAPASLSNGLLAYYPFNGNANDESGNGNQGTVNGATLTTDRLEKNNNAYSFSPSSNSHIVIPFSSSLGTIQTGITLSAWIYMDGGTGSSTPPRIMELRGGNAGFVMLSKDNSNSTRTFELRWYTNGGLSNISIPSTSISLTSLKWHHIVFTGEGTDGVAKYYFNGELKGATTTDKIASCNYNNNSLYIGAEPSLLGKWGGKLDDIRIYNRALTQEEITYLANN